MSIRNPVPFVEDVSLKTGFDLDYVTPPRTLQSNYIFQCGVCLGLPRDPMLIGCRHLLCNQCERSLHDKRCPICRTPFVHASTLRGSHPAFGDYMGHRVRCRMSERECGHVGNPIDVADHQGGCVNTPWIHPACGHHVSPFDRSRHEQYHQWERGIIL